MFCCFVSCFTEQYINQSWKPCQDSRRYFRILHCKWCQRSKKVIHIFLSLNLNKYYLISVFSLHVNTSPNFCYYLFKDSEGKWVGTLVNQMCACRFLNYSPKYQGNEIILQHMWKKMKRLFFLCPTRKCKMFWSDFSRINLFQWNYFERGQGL